MLKARLREMFYLNTVPLSHPTTTIDDHLTCFKFTFCLTDTQMETTEYFFSKTWIAILCLTGSPMVATVLLPLRRRWNKFTKILLLETTFFYLFLLLSSPPSLHTCEHVCFHVCMWMHMYIHVCICTCAYVCVSLRAEYCKMGRNIFLPCPTSPQNEGSMVLNFSKHAFLASGGCMRKRKSQGGG